MAERYKPTLKPDAESIISVRFRRREIRYTQQTSIPERLRLICDPELLSPYWQGIFDRLFPNELPPAEFDPESVDRSPLTKFTPSQKNLHKQLLNSFGFESPKLIATTNPLHVEELNIGFTEDRNALANRMNELPLIQRLGDLGQTDPQLKTTPERLRLKMTRLQHSQDFARSVIMTNLRLAIDDPELYSMRVKEDMQRYGILSAEYLGQRTEFSLSINSDSKNIVDKYAEIYFRRKKKQPEPQVKQKIMEALYLAYEYGKYMVFYAYIHDLKTTALGDAVMKMRPGEKQKGLTDSKNPEKPFSEDEELKNFFNDLLDNAETGFEAIARDFGLNKDLLRVMVKSLASEGDPCLPGFLMKDKHKYPDIVVKNFPWLREKIQSFDHDQRSGTRTNIAEIASEYFPGGFKHISHEHMLPVGSFEDRLRLLAYMIATGMTKEELTQLLHKLHVNPDDIFIAAEEFDFGPNIKLQSVALPDETGVYHEEILPVALDARAVERIALLFNMLTIFYYNSEERAGIEKIFQDMLGSCLYGIDGKIPLIGEDVFKIGTDTTVSEYLYNKARLMALAFKFFSEKTRLVMNDGLPGLIQEYERNDLFILAKTADLSYLINPKSGSLALLTKKHRRKGKVVKEKILGIGYWEDITRKRSDGEEDDPLSVAVRLENTNRFLQEQEFYHFITLTRAQLSYMLDIIDVTRDTTQAILGALSSWQNLLPSEGARVVIS